MTKYVVIATIGGSVAGGDVGDGVGVVVGDNIVERGIRGVGRLVVGSAIGAFNAIGDRVGVRGGTLKTLGRGLTASRELVWEFPSSPPKIGRSPTSYASYPAMLASAMHLILLVFT
jgi:hypothetical protein